MDTVTTTYNAETVVLGSDLLAAKWYYVAACTLLAYDYLLTLEREIEEIWEKKKGVIFYLFLINRYIPMAFCVVTLFAYFSPLWTFEICNRFAIVEWVQTLLIAVPAEIVLLYRIYALTNQNMFIVGILVSTIISQFSVVMYAISRPGTNNALHIPHYTVEPFHICVLFSDPHMDTAYLALSIFFDATVFLLTLLVTIRGYSVVPRTVLLRTIQRDGALYFCAILSGNIIWMVLALRARPGIKLLNAQPSMVITSIMISRLTISLRHASQSGSTLVESTLMWANDTGVGFTEI